MTPPPIKPPRQDDTPTRLRTNADRDLLKPRTPPRGAPVLAPYVDEDVTGKFDTGTLTREQLKVLRGEREPIHRIERLEDKHDELVGVVGELRQTVGEVSGKLDVLPDLIQAVRDSTERSAQREHVTFTAQVGVDTAKQIDKVHAVASHRDWVTRGLVIVAGLVTLAGTFAAGRC